MALLSIVTIPVGMAIHDVCYGKLQQDYEVYNWMKRCQPGTAMGYAIVPATLGGVDEKKILLETLYDKVAFVSQDNYLFDETVHENIRMDKLSGMDMAMLRLTAASIDRTLQTEEMEQMDEKGTAVSPSKLFFGYRKTGHLK